MSALPMFWVAAEEGSWRQNSSPFAPLDLINNVAPDSFSESIFTTHLQLLPDLLFLSRQPNDVLSDAGLSKQGGSAERGEAGLSAGCEMRSSPLDPLDILPVHFQLAYMMFVGSKVNQIYYKGNN